MPIAAPLIHWQRLHGRHHLPWQGARDPYAIWLSEVMLQQTQVATVIPYYLRFMQAFPTVRNLAEAPLDAVLALWSGLGYYSRARNLHAAANRIIQRYHGQFPGTRAEIEQLPGIGRSTAAAVAVFAFGQHEAILDGNVKRILARCFGIEGPPTESRTQRQLWEIAQAELPADYSDGNIETYTQALMDLGAMVCTRGTPRCNVCPLQQQCIARQQNRVDQLPFPKPRKSLPQKETAMLLLLHKHQLLLQKRPATGIWGSLWCPPTIEIGTDTVRYCLEQLGLEVQPAVDLPVLDHQFTHFKLRIYPRLLHVVPASMITPFRSVWVSPDDALEHGIPAPVRKLLMRNLLKTGEIVSNTIHI